MKAFRVMCSAGLCMGLYGASALAADSNAQGNAKSASQQIAIHVATANPSVVAIQARGALLNANISVGAQSSHCSMLVSQIAPTVCVPIGPGDPVSPN